MKARQKPKIGTGLVVIVLTIGGGSCFGPGDQAEDVAVNFIQNLGGTFARDKAAPNKPIFRVILSDTTVTDAGLKNLAGLKHLQVLDLSETKVTDAGLKQLSEFEQLRGLDLSATKVTDAGLKHLSGLKHLRTLFLSKTKVTDAGIEDLRKALPKLEISR